MPLDVKQYSAQRSNQVNIALERFDGGVVSLIDESKLPRNAAKEAVNLMQVEDGAWKPRWGSDWYGTAAPNGSAIDGGAVFTTEAGVQHLLMFAGGTVYRSLDDGENWATCTGATLTAGAKVDTLQIGLRESGVTTPHLLIFNGSDYIVRYDGTTILKTWSILNSPNAPTLTKNGLAGTSYNAYYRIVAVNGTGYSAASSESTVQVGSLRADWNPTGGSTNNVTLTWASVSGALRYDIYYSDTSNQELYIGSTTSLSFLDDGSYVQATNLLYPTDNTSRGPKFAHGELSTNRIWGTKDADAPWRVYFTGTGSNQGNFAAYYGGGYIDLERGGRHRPQRVVHYRDGKGSSYATVFTNDPEGSGKIWQISLESATIGDVTFVIPSAIELVGSRGTTSPFSVIKVLNDIVYFNAKGGFNLGSRAQYLNLLSTDEITANIRPDVRGIRTNALPNIAGYFYDAKIFQSVPMGSDVNNRIMVYDTEQKNWNPEAFTFGVERFFEYADQDGNVHLLAWKPNGTRFIELSRSIEGDMGEDFETSYTSPLMHVTRDRFGFVKVKEAQIELARPRGAINVELLGTEKRRGFSSLKSETIEAQAENVGWGTALWSSTEWSAETGTVDLFSEASIKRFFKVNKTLNTFQWHITTNSRSSDYVLRLLQVKGREVLTRKPSQWKL